MVRKGFRTTTSLVLSARDSCEVDEKSTVVSNLTVNRLPQEGRVLIHSHEKRRSRTGDIESVKDYPPANPSFEA